MAHHANKPEGPKGNYDISQSAMKPSIKHGYKWRISQGIKIGLNHFPGKVQEKRPEREAYFRYLRELISFQRQFLIRALGISGIRIGEGKFNRL